MNENGNSVAPGEAGELLVRGANVMGDLSQSSIDHVITLDMSQVNEIEVIRVPKSLVYGSNATDRKSVV